MRIRLPDGAARLLRQGYGLTRYALSPPPKSRKIFVLGTGRSGTHWVGCIMKAHPDIYVSMERPPIFPWVTQVAVDPRQRRALLPKVLRQYKIEHTLVAPQHFADKSHPNIWLAGDLAKAFPDSLFVGVRRSVYGTVASMLKHSGVMQWIHEWKRYPIPNRFLGIDEAEAATYESRSLAARCAMRWVSHSRQLDDLKPVLGAKYLILDYETLQQDTDAQLAALSSFLGLKVPLPLPPVKRESLDRWQTELTRDQIADIRAVVGENEAVA